MPIAIFTILGIYLVVMSGVIYKTNKIRKSLKNQKKRMKGRIL